MKQPKIKPLVLRGAKLPTTSPKPAFDVRPICPEVPCASHYDNDGCLPDDIRHRLEMGSARALDEMARLPKAPSK